MEEKEMQPTIQLKNSNIVLVKVKNSASIIFGLFFILLLFAKPFRKSKCPECKKREKKKAEKEQ